MNWRFDVSLSLPKTLERIGELYDGACHPDGARSNKIFKNCLTATEGSAGGVGTMSSRGCLH
jgi:hypothetical protein